MGTIVAIGGGELGRPGTKRETIPIDKHILELSVRKHPRLLFIPTASNDSQAYIDVIQSYFGKYLGCRIDTLRLTQKPSEKTIESKIDSADVIYVGGGNTKKMIKIWREYNMQFHLRNAYDNGTILSGVSAGAVCWFSFANSDSLKHITGDYCRIKGLGFVKGLACPHMVREPDRLPSFKKMVKQYGGIGYAIDDCAAVVFTDGKTYAINSKKNASVFIYTKSGKINRI